MTLQVVGIRGNNGACFREYCAKQAETADTQLKTKLLLLCLDRRNPLPSTLQWKPIREKCVFHLHTFTFLLKIIILLTKKIIQCKWIIVWLTNIPLNLNLFELHHLKLLPSVDKCDVQLVGMRIQWIFHRASFLYRPWLYAFQCNRAYYVFRL